MFSEAYQEMLFALQMLRSPWIDYWNPIAFSYRLEAAVTLNRLAHRLGLRPPRGDLEEQLAAIRMLRSLSQDDQLLAEEFATIHHCLAGRTANDDDATKA
jgi:hypothetical protein